MKAIDSRICIGKYRNSKLLEDGVEKFHQRQKVLIFGKQEFPEKKGKK